MYEDYLRCLSSLEGLINGGLQARACATPHAHARAAPAQGVADALLPHKPSHACVRLTQAKKEELVVAARAIEANMEAVQQAVAAVQAETEQDAAAITERLDRAARQKLSLLQVPPPI